MVKRLIDITGTMIGLIILSPVLIFLVILVRVKLGAPVLFRQNRPGLKGKTFIFYKFRTMTNKRDSHDYLLPDKDRITPLGNFLRKTSLDELPSLFNVLKGDMSLVGPRPLLVEYLDLYSPEQARRHDLKPGITGWAQINGRNAISWEKKFEFDLWYIKNASIKLDIIIIIKTIFITIQRKNIYNADNEVTEKFS